MWAMNELLARAFSEASKLPEEDQKAFATRILSELASERRWNEAFADSQDQLARLAEEALAEYRAGLTMELDPNEL